MELVQLCFRANVSMNSIMTMADQIEAWSGKTVGGCRSLADFQTVHLDMSMEHLKTRISKDCYPLFSTTIDGTPTFASAEAMKVRLVTLDWWIVEPLVQCKLLKKNQTATG